MGKINKSLKLGFIYGAAKALLFFVVSEYIISTYAHPSYSVCLVITFACSLSILILGGILFWISGIQFARFYWTSQVAFLLFCALQFVNCMTLHLGLFQPRELSNADGLILLVLQLSFLLYTELGQLTIFFAMILFKKTYYSGKKK